MYHLWGTLEYLDRGITLMGVSLLPPERGYPGYFENRELDRSS
jgi:hypothetical protein